MPSAVMASVDEIVAELNGHSRDFLLDLFVAPRSREEAEMLLLDMLTPEELQQVEQRVKAMVVSLIANTSGLPKTGICRALQVNYQTYKRADRLWRQNAGGMNLVWRIAKRHFPELKPKESK